jgi:hypothetical protein
VREPARRSWTANLWGFAFAVLAVCAVLAMAAELLVDALPVLLPALAMLCAATFLWRRYGRSNQW